VEKQPLEEADKLETINEIYDNNKRKINTNDNKTKVKSKKQKKTLLLVIFSIIVTYHNRR